MNIYAVALQYPLTAININNILLYCICSILLMDGIDRLATQQQEPAGDHFIERESKI